MTALQPGCRIAGDWYDGVVPGNVELHPDCHIESSYSFVRFRSHGQPALTVGRAAAVYKNTRFDIGARGRVEIGDFVMINEAAILCENHIRIGAYTLISWNVVLMDSYCAPRSVAERRLHLRALTGECEHTSDTCHEAKPIDIGENVWIGHDVVVLPGVVVGKGSVIGARSVVAGSIPEYCIAAGNPARIIRRFASPGSK